MLSYTVLKRFIRSYIIKNTYFTNRVFKSLKLLKKKEFKIEFINIPNPYLLPLFNFFASNFSFLILPDVISNNTPIPFL